MTSSSPKVATASAAATARNSNSKHPRGTSPLRPGCESSDHTYLSAGPLHQKRREYDFVCFLQQACILVARNLYWCNLMKSPPTLPGCPYFNPPLLYKTGLAALSHATLRVIINISLVLQAHREQRGLFFQAANN